MTVGSTMQTDFLTGADKNKNDFVTGCLSWLLYVCVGAHGRQYRGPTDL